LKYFEVMTKDEKGYLPGLILVAVEHIVLAMILLKNRIFREMPRWLELKYRYEKI